MQWTKLTLLNYGVVAVSTICMMALRRAGAVDKLAKFTVPYRPHSWHVTNTALNIHHAYVFIH